MGILVLLVLLLSLPGVVVAEAPVVVSVEKIWEQGDHNAFTDLIRHNDTWYCVFREAAGHVKGDGGIRIIASSDGKSWSSRALLLEKGVDLRDPKICLTPDKRLMVTMGGSVYQGSTLTGRRPRVTFSTAGRIWSPPVPVCREGDWLWRTTWYGDTAYGVTYSGPVADSTEWTLTLMQSSDGVVWIPGADLPVTGKPNETTLRFQSDGTLLALVRREGNSRNAFFGRSTPPYKEWIFEELDGAIGGPNFILFPDNRMWAAGRRYGKTNKMALGPLTADTYKPIVELPSGGDTSYPGLVWHEDMLWVSYYSSHEGKTCIYLAKIRL
ncbi:MAG: exo-alpha-sialidase [Candidatus Hydrogenedentes bacterium]|nr:exo-alpha-sialidase [Candidatus Hydrogenedentota bacterium]